MRSATGREGAHRRARRHTCRASPRTGARRQSSSQKRYRTTEPFLDGDGKPFRPAIYYGVGGYTKVYGAALPRFRREDFGVLETEDGVSPAWPITLRRARAVLRRSRAHVPCPWHGGRGSDRAAALDAVPVSRPSRMSRSSPSSPRASNGQGLQAVPAAAGHRPPRGRHLHPLQDVRRLPLPGPRQERCRGLRRRARPRVAERVDADRRPRDRPPDGSDRSARSRARDRPRTVSASTSSPRRTSSPPGRSTRPRCCSARPRTGTRTAWPTRPVWSGATT